MKEKTNTRQAYSLPITTDAKEYSIFIRALGYLNRLSGTTGGEWR